MKLPSVQQVFRDAWQTFLRFPFVLITAAIGTIAVVILIDHEGPPQPTILFNIMLAAILGIPLLTGFALLAEKQKWPSWMTIGLQIFGVLLLAGYGTSVPSDLVGAPAVHILRMLLIAVGLHLFVSFAPFISRGELNGFWHYNKTLLLRVIITGLYTAVLFAGLALALAALDNLFGVNVPGKRYGQLWFVILGVFTTWIFLAGIPEKLEQLEAATDYPKGIKIFAQYILFPLVIVYLIILYAYLGKILVDWDWPQGWVGRLILGFAATGIFSLLLLYPVRNLSENVWIKGASRWFYVVMSPLVIMLLLALWRRISEYGITEGRYIGLVLGFWLGGIVLYFILSRVKSIKTIPVSLCVISLIICFGPWGAFSISEKSQIERLRDLLTTRAMLVDDQIRKASGSIPQQDVQEISSILAYLHDIHGYARIQPWFRESLRADSTGKSLKYKEPGMVAGMIGIEYLNVRYGGTSNDIRLGSSQSEVIDVQGFDRLIRGVRVNMNQEKKAYTDQELQYRISAKLDTIFFNSASHGIWKDSLQIDLGPLFARLVADYGTANISNIPPDIMKLQAESANIKVKLYFRYINLHREEDLIEPVGYGFDLLYKINKTEHDPLNIIN